MDDTTGFEAFLLEMGALVDRHLKASADASDQGRIAEAILAFGLRLNLRLMDERQMMLKIVATLDMGESILGSDDNNNRMRVN
ncbi:MAG: hypothetical protein HQL64_12450 [Magnetococcales bacterium]|nr:hypothetical protein [Magnetococcales bacterium]